VKTRLGNDSWWKTTQHAVSLIECLVYITAAAVVFGAGTAALYRAMEDHAALRRSTEDITQAMAAGEQWRKDVRAATGKIEIAPDGNGFQVSQGDDWASYKWVDGKLMRQTSQSPQWLAVLQHVKTVEFISERRDGVPGWRLELELKPRRERNPVKPLFTFLAVAKSS